MNKKQKLMVLCSVVLFVTSIAGADTYTMIFNTSDNPFTPGVKNQGWWSDSRNNIDDNDNYLTGVNYHGIHRSFFTFDLTSLEETVLSAKLELTRFEYTSGADSETLGFFDVQTESGILNNNVGHNSVIYNDLGTGSCYGEYEVLRTGSTDDILCFELNSSAIVDINASAGGWFSSGCTLLSLGSPDVNGTETLFGFSHEAGTQRLVVEVIPEPCTLSILSLGSIFLIRRGQK